MSEKDYIYLLSLANFYNNDFEFIQKNYFSSYSVD